jgi:hypothetical protein
MCISLPGHRWLSEFIHRIRMPVYQCDGTDLIDLIITSESAIEAARRDRKPVAIIFSNITRRFGHAATDRQSAYLTSDWIQAAADKNPIEYACQRLAELGVMTYDEMYRMYNEIDNKVERAFDEAVNERKITTRQEVIDSTSQPLAPMPVPRPTEPSVPTDKFPDVMRKHMTRVIVEQLEANPNMVYIGEVYTTHCYSHCLCLSVLVCACLSVARTSLSG